MPRKPKRKPSWKLADPPKITPLDPGKPLAPYRVPALKAFDRCMPGQGMLDLSGDGEVTVTYADGDGEDAS